LKTPAICRQWRRADAFARIEDSIAKIVEAGKRPVSLGGDHSITYPILRGIGKQIPAYHPRPFRRPSRFYGDYEGNPTPTPARSRES